MLSQLSGCNAPAACRLCSSAPSCSPRVLVQLATLRGRRGDQGVCQAHPRRVAKVSSQIQREISEMFIYDSVVANAICPERNQGYDNSLTALASVTEVYVSNDLQVVKVYVSVYSDERGKQRAMANLKRLEPYVRSQIGQRVRLRLTPEIRFEYDDSIEEAELVQRVMGPEFDRLQREAEEEARGLPPGSLTEAGASAGSGAAGEDDEDEDGGFFDDVGEGDEGEEGEWVEEDIASFLARPGPFDDLFVGNEEGTLVQDRRRGARPISEG